MAQPDRNSSRDNKRNNEPNFNWRGIVLIAIAFGLIGMALLVRNGGYQNIEDVPYNRFIELLDNKQIINDKNLPVTLLVQEGQPTQALIGFYRKQTAGAEQAVKFRTTIYLNYNTNLQDKLAAAGIQPAIRTESNLFAQTLLSFLPIALFLLVLYFLFRQQIRMAGKGALNFGKSKARMLARDKNKITFRDVAGVEEAKDEVQELVEFLRDPKKFQKLGGRIPKGVLMVGPPGTGKTLLARAIAGEADVPFFSISGSDFVEMFVGVGASRVRDMFEQGKKSAPCIIFIDEIDAVGRHRGHGVGGGHDEREQTLNALLVEMDGFDTQEGVIIIAATNRPDVLDPALLRPGRFDRQITVNLPDVKGREEILRVHAKKVKLAEGVDLQVVARGTPGYSGAELANVINEAALLAARRGLKGITLKELEEARDKVRWGKERRSMALSEKEKTNTAYHEAGHALVAAMLPNSDPLHKVTIVPRGRALGLAFTLPEDDRVSITREQLEAHLVRMYGGRVAEELVFGRNRVTTGAASDIQQATSLARRYVGQWGLSDAIGPILVGDNEQELFLGRELQTRREVSERTAQLVDSEVSRVIKEAYARATAVLEENIDLLHTVATALLDRETLTGDEVAALARGETLPPRVILPPPSAPPALTTPVMHPKPSKPPLFGGPEVAPA